jgi:hypothetical protein
MGNTSNSVFGAFESRVQAEHAVQALRAAGFQKEDFSVMFPESTETAERRIAGVSDVGSYSGAMVEEGILVSVRCDDPEQVSQAMDVMQKTGGKMVASTGETSAGSSAKG